METVGKTLKVVKNNWKKSVFISICAFYGTKYAHSKYRMRTSCMHIIIDNSNIIWESRYLRKICLEAKAYGDAPISPTAKPRHVTVILNPTANDGKCRAQFDKYCGPLLNLAGLKVGIIKTEREGQAKDIMEVMDNTDAVVVAGGDGTVAEVVTGLMRRADRPAAVQQLPLALIPLGRTNSVSAALAGGADTDAATRITQATMALVRDTVRPLDVMEVQAVETEAEVPGRPVYLLSNISWGAFRDVQSRVNTYWYWGGLRQRVAYVLNVFRDLTWRCDAEMEYTAHCAGCSRCHQQQQEREQQQREQQQERGTASTRWWSSFVPKPTPPPCSVEPEVQHTTVENAQCGVWHRQTVSGLEWQLRTSHMLPDTPPGLHLRLGPESMTASEFVSEGWRRSAGGEPMSVQQLAVGQVRLTPAPELRSAVATGIPATKSESSAAGVESSVTSLEGSASGTDAPVASVASPTTSSSADTDKSANTAANTRWFSFDSEEFEVRPVLVRLLPQAVRVYADQMAPSAAPS